MDSGDTVDLTCVLLAPEDQDQPAPLVAITTVVIGYEIDNYDYYVLQIQTFKDAFIKEMGIMWKWIVGVVAFDILIAIAAASGWPLVIALASAVLLTAMVAI